MGFCNKMTILREIAFSMNFQNYVKVVLFCFISLHNLPRLMLQLISGTVFGLGLVWDPSIKPNFQKYLDQQMEVLMSNFTIVHQFKVSTCIVPLAGYLPPAVRYTKYSRQFKLSVVKHAEERGNRDAARQFLVNESHVRYWRKQKERLLTAEDS